MFAPSSHIDLFSLIFVHSSNVLGRLHFLYNYVRPEIPWAGSDYATIGLGCVNPILAEVLENQDSMGFDTAPPPLKIKKINVTNCTFLESSLIWPFQFWLFMDLSGNYIFCISVIFYWLFSKSKWNFSPNNDLTKSFRILQCFYTSFRFFFYFKRRLIIGRLKDKLFFSFFSKY